MLGGIIRPDQTTCNLGRTGGHRRDALMTSLSPGRRRASLGNHSKFRIFRLFQCYCCGLGIPKKCVSTPGSLRPGINVVLRFLAPKRLIAAMSEAESPGCHLTPAFQSYASKPVGHCDPAPTTSGRCQMWCALPRCGTTT